jgi:hypothetical protein
MHIKENVNVYSLFGAKGCPLTGHPFYYFLKIAKNVK